MDGEGDADAELVFEFAVLSTQSFPLDITLCVYVCVVMMEGDGRT